MAIDLSQYSDEELLSLLEEPRPKFSTKEFLFKEREPLKKFKGLFPEAGEVSGQLAERAASAGEDISPKITAGIAGLYGSAREQIPTNIAELGLTALFSGLPGRTINYLKRVAPGMIELLPGIGKVGEKGLLLRPKKVAKLAKEGIESIQKQEIKEFSQLQKETRKVLKDTSAKYGKTESEILKSAGDPIVNQNQITNLLNETENISEAYRVLPEFQTAKLINPQLSKTLNSVINDITKFRTRPGDVKLSEILNLRKQINRVERQSGDNLALKSASNRIKQSTTELINNNLPEQSQELFQANNIAYKNVLDKYNRVKRFLKDASSTKRIASEVVNETNLIKDFKDFLGNAQMLDEITATVGARKFTPGAFQGLLSRASFPNIIFGPLGLASRLPILPTALAKLGLPTTPQGVAQFASLTSQGLKSPLAPLFSALLGQNVGRRLTSLNE